MIITRTPYRISFFGGGTDYHSWYQENGGSVLSTTISYYCNLTCSHKPPFFDSKHRIVWREIEEVNEAHEIKHPVVSAVLKHMDIKRGIEMFYQGDLPARAGLGSSSSFAVGFLNAMHSLRGNISTKQQLAAEAVYIEREILKENVGVQDQIAAAYGGFNKIDIYQDGNFDVNPVLSTNVKIDELKNNLMLFFTGVSRNATDIAKEQIKTVSSKKNELVEMQKMVQIANDIVVNGSDMNDFGKLLHESWCLKRGLTKGISSDLIDSIYKKAMGAGATGGKLLGAGGGGFMLFYVKAEHQPKVLEALSDFLWVPFDFERRGSHVAFYSPSKFSRESLVRRDFAHLKEARKSKNVQNITQFLREERNRPVERLTKFNIVE